MFYNPFFISHTFLLCIISSFLICSYLRILTMFLVMFIMFFLLCFFLFHHLFYVFPFFYQLLTYYVIHTVWLWKHSRLISCRNFVHHWSLFLGDLWASPTIFFCFMSELKHNIVTFYVYSNFNLANRCMKSQWIMNYLFILNFVIKIA